MGNRENGHCQKQPKKFGKTANVLEKTADRDSEDGQFVHDKFS